MAELTLSETFRTPYREIIFPECPTNEVPAHVYLRSVHHIAIERSWLRLRLDFGDNAVLFFNKGIEDGIYNPEDPLQLCVILYTLQL